MRKPISPEEWDRASAYQKRKGAVPAERPAPEVFRQQMLDYALAEIARIGDRALIKQMLNIGGRERVVDGALRVCFNANSLSGWSVFRYLDGHYDVAQKRYVSTSPDMSDDEFAGIIRKTLDKWAYTELPKKLVDAAGNIIKRGDQCIVLPGDVPGRDWDCSKSFGRIAAVGGMQRIDSADNGLRLACWIKPASHDPFIVESKCFESKQSTLLWLPRQLLLVGGGSESAQVPHVLDGVSQ